MRRIIFIHCGPFAYQEIRLGGSVGLVGRDPWASQALEQALRYASDPAAAAPTVERQWLRRPEARLIYEVQGPEGWFLVLALPQEKGPGFFLIHSDYERELFVGKKEEVLSEKALFKGLAARNVKVSPRLDRWEEYLHLATAAPSGSSQKKAAQRYAWLSGQPLDLLRRLQAQGSAAVPVSQAVEDLKSFLAWEPEAAASLGLEKIRTAVQQYTRQREELRRMAAEEDALVAWLESHRASQEVARQLQAQREEWAAQWPHLQAAQRQAQQAWEAAQQRAEQQAAWQAQRAQLVQAEIELIQRRIGAEEQQAMPSGTAEAILPPPDGELYWQAQHQIRTARAHLQQLYQQALAIEAPKVNLDASHFEALLQARADQVQQQAQRERLEAQVKDWEAQRQQGHKTLDQLEATERQAFESHRQALENQLAELEERIQGSGQTFMGWLEGRYPDWEENIGKVVREEVLFHPYLSPSVERLNDLLFGVQLDLSELEAPVTGVQHLQDQRDELVQSLEDRQAAWTERQAELARQRQNLDKRSRAKITQLQREVQQARYLAEQAALREKRWLNQQQARQLARQQRYEQAHLRLQYQTAAQEKELRTLEAEQAQREQEWQAASSASETSRGEQDDEALLRLKEKLAYWQSQAQQQPKPVDLTPTATEAQQWDTLLADLSAMDLPEVEPAAQAAEVPVEARLAELERWRQQEAGLAELQAALREQALHWAAQLQPDNVLRLPTDSRAEGWLDAWAEALAELLAGEGLAGQQAAFASQRGSLIGQVAELLGDFDAPEVLGKRVEQVQALLHAEALPEGLEDLRLTLQPGGHPLMRVLRDLRRLHREQGHALGGQSLFSQGEAELDLAADELLERLIAALQRYPHDQLSRAQAFDLEVTVQLDDGSDPQPWSMLPMAWQRPLAMQMSLAAWQVTAALRPAASLPLWLGADLTGTAPHASQLLRQARAGLLDVCAAAADRLVGVDWDLVYRFGREDGKSQGKVLVEKK